MLVVGQFSRASSTALLKRIRSSSIAVEAVFMGGRAFCLERRVLLGTRTEGTLCYKPKNNQIRVAASAVVGTSVNHMFYHVFSRDEKIQLMKCRNLGASKTVCTRVVQTLTRGLHAGRRRFLCGRVTLCVYRTFSKKSPGVKIHLHFT